MKLAYSPVAWRWLARREVVRSSTSAASIAPPPVPKVISRKSKRTMRLGFVRYVAHNALGQRIVVALGNDIVVRHRYDPRGHRLVAMRSEPAIRSTPPATTTWQTAGAPVQDATYAHDLWAISSTSTPVTRDAASQAARTGATDRAAHSATTRCTG